MPKPTKKQTLATWEALLQSVQENERKLPGIEPFREALTRAQDKTLAHQSVRDGLVSSTAEAQGRLEKAFADGRDAAICLRTYIKGVLGPWTAELRRYGMKPRRRRARSEQRRSRGTPAPG